MVSPDMSYGESVISEKYGVDMPWVNTYPEFIRDDPTAFHLGDAEEGIVDDTAGGCGFDATRLRPIFNLLVNVFLFYLSHRVLAYEKSVWINAWL